MSLPRRAALRAILAMPVGFGTLARSAGEIINKGTILEDVGTGDRPAVTPGPIVPIAPDPLNELRNKLAGKFYEANAHRRRRIAYFRNEDRYIPIETKKSWSRIFKAHVHAQLNDEAEFGDRIYRLDEASLFELAKLFGIEI